MSTDSILIPPRDLEATDRRIVGALLGADYSARSITPQRSDRAPDVIRGALPRFSQWCAPTKTDLTEVGLLDFGQAGAMRMQTWDDAFSCLEAASMRALEAAPFVLSLGGDHSVTWPLFSGVHRHLAAKTGQKPRIGIVQFDAHHDVRSLDSGPSNGTPIRGLIESDLVNPRDIIQVGIHPFANRREHTDYCSETGIKRISMGDLAERGIDGVMASIGSVIDGCQYMYITVDIDVLDRSCAPGTVASMPGGMQPEMLMEFVRRAVMRPNVVALDVVEYDPTIDVADITARSCAHVVMQTLSSLAARVVATKPSEVPVDA